MPPAGTRHSPVPSPIRWYRKHRLASKDSERSDVCVPISASVATTPRTTSCVNVSSIASPIGRSKTWRHKGSPAASTTAVRSSSRDGSGDIMVGATALAIAASSAYQRDQFSNSVSDPVSARNDAAVSGPGSRSTSSPAAPSTGV